MKKFIRFLVLAAVVVAVVWATRDRMLPEPQLPDANPPPFRRPPQRPDVQAPDAVAGEAPVPQPTETASSSDDLQRVKGIGPVYEGRLRDLGITTFSALIGADSAAVAEKLEVSVESVVDWKTQATEFID